MRIIYIYIWAGRWVCGGGVCVWVRVCVRERERERGDHDISRPLPCCRTAASSRPLRMDPREWEPTPGPCITMALITPNTIFGTRRMSGTVRGSSLMTLWTRPWRSTKCVREGAGVGGGTLGWAGTTHFCFYTLDLSVLLRFWSDLWRS